MSTYELLVLAYKAVGWAGAGALIGSLHFLALQWVVSGLTAGRSPLLLALLQLMRLAALAVLLTIVVREFGALPLLIVTVGMIIARAVVLCAGVPQP